jgi:hypothetical protein
LLRGGVIISLSAHSQTTRFKDGSLFMPTGNVIMSGDKDIRFGANTLGTDSKWSIEYFGSGDNYGLNFWKPDQPTSIQNYKLFLHNNGRVGVGTNTPLDLLDVRGTIRARDGFVMEGYSWGGHWNAVYLNVTSSGNGSAVLFPHVDRQLSIGKPNHTVHVHARQVWATWFTTTSDERLKENIHDIETPLAKINKLKGVQYNMTDSQKSDNLKSSNKDKIQSKDNIGFLAQDLQKIFPELVMEQDSTGIFGINYIGLIPVLVEALKEQQAQIVALQVQAASPTSLAKRVETLEKQLSQCCKVQPGTGNGRLKAGIISETGKETQDALETYVIVLHQNSPNPFSQSTTIQMEIPMEVNDASLTVYNLAGEQKLSIPVEERGAATVRIEAGKLNPGIYIYGIVADGELAASRQMIVTE